MFTIEPVDYCFPSIEIIEKICEEACKIATGDHANTIDKNHKETASCSRSDVNDDFFVKIFRTRNDEVGNFLFKPSGDSNTDPTIYIFLFEMINVEQKQMISANRILFRQKSLVLEPLLIVKTFDPLVNLDFLEYLNQLETTIQDIENKGNVKNFNEPEKNQFNTRKFVIGFGLSILLGYVLKKKFSN